VEVRPDFLGLIEKLSEIIAYMKGLPPPQYLALYAEV
jgi:hypothetical protein